MKVFIHSVICQLLIFSYLCIHDVRAFIKHQVYKNGLSTGHQSLKFHDPHPLSNQISFNHWNSLSSSQLPKKMKSLAVMSSASSWSSSVSLNEDLYLAIDEVIERTLSSSDSSANYDVAIFFVSSIYETASFKTTKIMDALKKKIPSIKYVIGCTTGAVIGSLEPFGEPNEIEARAGLGLTLAKMGDDITKTAFRLTPEEINDYLNPSSSSSSSSSLLNLIPKKAKDSGSVTFLLATENVKNNLAALVTKLKDETGTETFGAVASSVTSLHMPKLFLSSSTSASTDNSNSNDELILERFNNGIVGLTFSGDIMIQSIVARSCLPVGPVFQVEECKGSEILSLRRIDLTGNSKDVHEATSPLVQLDDVLRELTNDQSYSLKRELLVGLVPGSNGGSTEAIVKAFKGASSIMDSSSFFGQKPTSFDPFTGSITVPCLPGKGSLMQFCVRDAAAARQDLQTSIEKLQNLLQQSTAEADSNHAMAMLVLGSMERGNKVFRYQSWESGQVHYQLKSAELANKVPVAGFFSSGTISMIKGSDDDETPPSVAIMETDSVYALLTKLPKNKSASTTTSTSAAVASSSSSSSSPLASEDIMTQYEVEYFSDVNDGVIVTKRDPESAHPTRVAGMDYFVPDKIPQPKNSLESLVWDREKDVDRMRERFQMSRALIQAKASEAKFPKRNFIQTIKDMKTKRSLLSAGGSQIPLIMIELVRNSLHNGKMVAADGSSSDISTSMIADLAKVSEQVGAVSIGYNVDMGTFRGQYEDLEACKLSTSVPIFCNDFVVYGYQLFKAKSSGADSIKLMASILSAQDIAYFIKIAKALSLLCIVVVSSKVQLLDVLANVPGVQVISVTSRNMRLWKIQPNKAAEILKDPEVIAAIKAHKQSSSSSAAAAVAGTATANDEGELIILQEGFSKKEELVEAYKNGVDAVILGEELLIETSKAKLPLAEAVKKWILV